MASRRIVIETPCIHGETTRHRAADPDSYLSTYLCDGAHRRTLTEGDYVLVEKQDGEWPYVLSGEVHRILDALAGGGE